MSVPSLVATLRCPRCGKLVFGNDPEIFRGILVCERKSCGQRWWAMAFSAGALAPQLMLQLDVDQDFADALIRVRDLPTSIPEPLFWQLPITPHEHHRWRSDGSRSMLSALIHRFRTA